MYYKKQCLSIVLFLACIVMRIKKIYTIEISHSQRPRDVIGIVLYFSHCSQSNMIVYSFVKRYHREMDSLLKNFLKAFV